MRIISVILGVIGFLLITFALSDLTIWLQGSSVPQVLTLRDAGTPGKIKNYHLTITDFVCSETIGVSKRFASIEKAWVPLLVVNEDNTTTPPERLVIAYVGSSLDISETTSEELDKLFDKTEITGVIANGVDPIPSDQVELLQDVLKRGDIDKAIIIDVSRQFPSTNYLFGRFAVGTAMLAVTLGVFFATRKKVKNKATNDATNLSAPSTVVSDR
ncbi:hypothetical protein [Bremerella sp.]|uniref:hypothetical protein n=1 Tax=Bremerella sp. TaxID=2795602 RepID=UPI003919CD69